MKLNSQGIKRIFLQKDFCLVLGLSSIAIIIWSIVFFTTFDGLVFTDSYEYADIAQNIYEHKGFTSNIINPVNILFTEDNIKDHRIYAPKVPPLHPLFISGLFHMFWVSEGVVGLSTGILFILTVPFIFLLAKSLFGSIIAVLSSLIYIFDTHLLFTYSICGLTEPMFMFFLIIFFYVLYKSTNYKQFLLAGVVMGLANLTRLDPFFYILPIVVYLILSLKNDRIKNIGSFLFGYIIMMSPYFIFCYIKFDNPLILFSRGYEMLPADKYTSLADNTSPNNLYGLILTLAESFLGILKKMYINLSEYYHRFFQIANPYILAFFVVSIFKTYKNKNVRNFSILFLGLFTVQIMLSSAAIPPPKGTGQFRHLFIFYPLMIIFASSLIVSLFKRFKQSSRLTKYSFGFLIFILICLPTITDFYHISRSNLKISHHNFKEIGEMVVANTSPDEIVATDITSRLAWYSHRKVVKIPVPTKQLDIIDSKIQINSMLITQSTNKQLRFYNNHELTKDWGNFLNGFPESFHGFELKEKIEQDGKILAVLYKK